MNRREDWAETCLHRGFSNRAEYRDVTEGGKFAVRTRIKQGRVRIHAPDIHIFTESKQPWVVIPDGLTAVARYYDRNGHWPAASLERLKEHLAR